MESLLLVEKMFSDCYKYKFTGAHISISKEKDRYVERWRELWPFSVDLDFQI